MGKSVSPLLRFIPRFGTDKCLMLFAFYTVTTIGYAPAGVSARRSASKCVLVRVVSVFPSDGFLTLDRRVVRRGSGWAVLGRHVGTVLRPIDLCVPVRCARP